MNFDLIFRYNLCTGSVQHVTELCDEIRERIFKPLMRSPNENFHQMADALLLGMKPVVVSMDKDAFQEFTRRIVGLPKRDLDDRLRAKFILDILLYIFTVILPGRWLAVIFRPVLNMLLRFAIYCNTKLPLVAIWMFGEVVLETDSVLYRRLQSIRKRMFTEKISEKSTRSEILEPDSVLFQRLESIRRQMVGKMWWKSGQRLD